MDRLREKLLSLTEQELKSIANLFDIQYDSLAGNTNKEKSKAIYNYIVAYDLNQKIDNWFKTRHKLIPIYFSYAWKDEENTGREQLVDQLYELLEKENYVIKRDRKNLLPGQSIETFMSSLGVAPLIVVFLTKKYLESFYCMFELFEVYRNSKLKRVEFQKKIFPLFIEVIDINEKDIYTYWNKKKETMCGNIKEVKYICDHCEDIISSLKDINTPKIIDIRDGEKIISDKLRNQLIT